MGKEMKNYERFDSYLGDGVYASFDGYQIWLAANYHENKVVALEPAVFGALERYVGWLRKEIGGEQDIPLE